MPAIAKKKKSRITDATTKTNGAVVPKTHQKIIEIPEIEKAYCQLSVVGITPLVVHAFAEKSRKEMRDKQAGEARAKKAARDPAKEYIDSMYWAGDVPESFEEWEENRADFHAGIPEVAFKCALVAACRMVADIPMTRAKQMFFVSAVEPFPYCEGMLCKVHGDMAPFESVVRIGKGATTTSDLRYRFMLKEWRTNIRVEFRPNMVTIAALANLVRNAGDSVGVCEGRPERGAFGWGRFEVEDAKLIG